MTPTEILSTLSRADAARIKPLAERILPDLGEITVVHNRTGLVMLPLRDTAQGTVFHLGEVLVAEAQITGGGATGYGMRRGRDQEAAMAMALIDLALTLGVHSAECHDFCRAEAARHAAEDTGTLREVAATRVDMETF